MLNELAYVGKCILDWSNSIMLFYNYIKEKYSHKAKLYFTGADSLTYEINTNDVY